MLHIYNLRVKLQERRNRLHKVGYRQYAIELQLFLEFLEQSSHLNALVKELDDNASVDIDSWKEEHGSYFNTFPPSEADRAKLCFHILGECASDLEGRQAINWANRFSNERHFDDMIGEFNDTVLDVFWNYLDDRLDESGVVLYLLERFKLKSEWFQRSALWQIYSNDTSFGEKNLDRVLREALFDGGVDFPFSEPTSPSGKADIVALGVTEDPLVLEVKIFDPDHGKDKSHLRQGFHQVLRYANDYQQAVGYLAIFNCSSNQLVLPSESDGEFPPRVVHDGKTMFLITIDISEDRDPASREDPKKRVEVSRSDLVG